MRVKVRRAFFGVEGQTREGQILDISESRYRQLSEGVHKNFPLVDATEVGYKMAPEHKNKADQPPANKEAAKTGPADPTSTPPAGGQTGEASVVSSSEPAPQLSNRQYRRRGTKRE